MHWRWFPWGHFSLYVLNVSAFKKNQIKIQERAMNLTHIHLHTARQGLKMGASLCFNFELTEQLKQYFFSELMNEEFTL